MIQGAITSVDFRAVDGADEGFTGNQFWIVGYRSSHPVHMFGIGIPFTARVGETAGFMNGGQDFGPAN